MKITLSKKLTKQQKQEFIYKDKSYDWQDNYIKLIRDYIEAEWSYDEDNRHCLCDGCEINDILMYDINNMFDKSGLNISNKNNIKYAITKLCKENAFSEKRKLKQEKKQEKEEQLQNLPDRLFQYIQTRYGDLLSYNVSNKQTYYREKMITKFDINNITMSVKSNIMFKSVNKSDIQTTLYEVAKLRSFQEKINIDMSSDNTWNILQNVNADHWEDYLEFDDKNNLKHNTYNYSVYLTFHPQFRDNISYNSFDKIESLRMFDKDYGIITTKPIDDDVVNLIKAHIERQFGDFNNKYIETALAVVLNNNSYHEIKQKFKRIEEQGWDGIPRMHNIMIKYFGCDDIPEIREMTEVMLCGSVQRILEEKPNEGTMFDYMGVMFGKQGTGKTKFMTRLYFGDKYTSINPDVNDDQKFTDLANRAWLVLFDEMKSIDKADMGTVKSRITEQGSNVRLSYGRRSKYYPRHISFWGNTNYKGVYRDDGYERRFLSFECKNEKKHTVEWWNKNYTDYDIDQIWAETLEIYHNKWENKVITISQSTEDWNYKIQIKHKVWVEDSRTDLELKEIFNCKGYLYPYWLPDKWRIWMKQLDQLKLNGSTNEGSYDLKMVNCKWVLSRIQRRQEWINGMVEQLGWKTIHVNDDVFGDEDYYIRPDIKFEDIKNEYLSCLTDNKSDENTNSLDKYSGDTMPF